MSIFNASKLSIGIIGILNELANPLEKDEPIIKIEDLNFNDLSQNFHELGTCFICQKTGIDVSIDRVPGIAHNKVMIIDKYIVIHNAQHIGFLCRLSSPTLIVTFSTPMPPGSF